MSPVVMSTQSFFDVHTHAHFAVFKEDSDGHSMCARGRRRNRERGDPAGRVLKNKWGVVSWTQCDLESAHRIIKDSTKNTHHSCGLFCCGIIKTCQQEKNEKLQKRDYRSFFGARWHLRANLSQNRRLNARWRSIFNSQYARQGCNKL